MITDDDKENIKLNENVPLPKPDGDSGLGKKFESKDGELIKINVDSDNKPVSESKDTQPGKSGISEQEIKINKNESVRQEVPLKTKTSAELVKSVKAESKEGTVPVSLQKPIKENNSSDMQKNLNMKQTNIENQNTVIDEETVVNEDIEKDSFSSGLYKEPEIENCETAYFLSAVFSRNPVFVLMLGLGPALAVTTKLTNGIGLGIIVLLTMLLSNVVISALKGFIPSKIRLPFYLTITGSIASVIIIFVKAFLPDLANSLGIFLPLTAVNSVIFECAENFASKKKIMSTALNSVGTGIGFMLVLILISFIREFFGTLQFDFSDFGLGVYGFDKISICGVPVYEHADFFILPAGAFITLGILLAVKQAVQNHFNKNIED